MALIAKLNDIRPSDPDGLTLLISVSYQDDTNIDPKTGEATIVASKVFTLDPSATKTNVKDIIVSHGLQVKASRAAATAFATQYPVGTTIAVG